MSDQPIPFNRPCPTGDEMVYLTQAVENGWASGGGPFTGRAQSLLEQRLGTEVRALLTTSCTHALEMAAILLDLHQGDEVIVPSFTFVSTALAFLMHGATPVFCDIRPDTLNLDEKQVESLVTDRTRAIVPVHYAGVGCEMDMISAIAERYDLTVVEDNAHGLFGSYQGRKLGTWGQLATQSFHETKNIICGEGGALIINDPRYIERAEIIREKGTNRSRFFRGEVDKYTWVDKGSSYVMSDMLAAFLYAQLLNADLIQEKRRHVWETYDLGLRRWADRNGIGLPVVPDGCEQSFHMFYLLMPSAVDRTGLLAELKAAGIYGTFHYQPLHDSIMGKTWGRTSSNCPVARDVSDRLMRLPFYNDITEDDLARVIDRVTRYRSRGRKTSG